jgi:uncharacterized Zn finger protein (UPF0148 family)
MRVLENPNGSATPGAVYCPICTHTVEADVVPSKKGPMVRPGQKCARCHASLDAGYVLRMPQAA